MEKSNDDGEPSGTAGRPILEFLKNNDLENVALVVVRYFGGIKLGAGGLLRAYIDASKAVFEASNVFLVEEQNVYSLTVDYSLYDILNNYLLKQDGQVLKTEYEMKVSIDYLCSSLDEERINNLLNGQVEILSKGKQKVYIKQ
jgi:putative IMPACT (imprinted ancient) family translation regulator